MCFWFWCKAAEWVCHVWFGDKVFTDYDHMCMGWVLGSYETGSRVGGREVHASNHAATYGHTLPNCMYFLIDDPWYHQISTSSFLAFLAKHWFISI